MYAQSCPALCDPMDCSLSVPLSMEFSRQEYWSGLPFPTPGDLPDPEIKPASLASPALASKFFTTSATQEAQMCVCVCVCVYIYIKYVYIYIYIYVHETLLGSLVYSQYQQTLLLSLKKCPLSTPREQPH